MMIVYKKIEAQIQQFSRRHLSLRGKAILLNSLILPKVTFLSNVFPINNEIQKQLEKQSGNSVKKNQLQAQHYSFLKNKDE